MKAAIVAVAISLATAAHAQQSPERRITVTVIDGSGAVIPGAHIAATQSDSNLHFEVTADIHGPSAGSATLTLPQGNYTLRISARRFQTWEERAVVIESDTSRKVALAIDNFEPVEVNFVNLIPVEHRETSTQISLAPIQLLQIPARQFRSRQHWF